MKHSVNKTTKTLAIALSAALICGISAEAVYASGGTSIYDKALSTATEANAKAGEALETINGTSTGTAAQTVSASTQMAADSTLSKNETVFVIADAQGKVQKVTVSDELKNVAGAESLTDSSCLSDITNVKGTENYTKNPDGSLNWDAQGNDIYYQGTTDKTLPVQVAISYKLDGKSVTADELKGKSGKAVIRIDYKNDKSVTGNSTVPFLAMTGLILDNDHFKNIRVSSGKIIDDGNRSVVVGFALPGFSDDLDISSGEAKIPDYVEITADAKNFALESTYTYVSCDFVQDIDTDKIGNIGELTSALDQASSAVTKLTSGSSALYDGLCQLLEKSGEMNTGIGTLYSGATELSTGLSALDSNSATLKNGAYQVFASLTANATTQLNASLTANGLPAVTLTPDNYAKVLGGLLDQFSSGAYSQAKAAAETKVRPLVEAAVLQQVTDGVKATVKASLVEKGYTEDQANAYLSGGDGAATVNSYVQQKMASDEIKRTIESTIAAKIASQEVQSQISSAVDSGLSGNASYSSIKSLKASLDSYAAFYSGLSSYTAGVSSAAGGATKVAGGLGQLAKGGQSLVSGVTQLRDGAMQLSDGMQQFSSEISSKLGSLSKSELKSVLPRLNTMLTAARSYTNYSGIADGEKGTVKFIIKTASI